MDPNERQEALILLDIGGNTTLVRSYFERKTRKVVSVSINNELPHTINLICYFHMLKYISTKISSYSCSQDQKKEQMKLTKKAVYSHSAQKLNETMKHLEDLLPQFHEHMSKNWLSCKQSWCTYEQKDLFKMFNTTTNRIEAHHRVLKLYLKSSASLERMYTSLNTSEHSSILQPFFKHCTSFAAHKIAEEYKRASSRSYQIIKLDDGFKVCGTMVCVIPQLMSSCICSFFSAMNLSCHYLIHLLV